LSRKEKEKEGKADSILQARDLQLGEGAQEQKIKIMVVWGGNPWGRRPKRHSHTRGRRRKTRKITKNGDRVLEKSSILVLNNTVGREKIYRRGRGIRPERSG